jgi:hypothetical protein
MSVTRTQLGSFAAALLLLGAVACDDSSGPTTAETLTAAQADLVAEVVTVDVDEIIETGSFDAVTGVPMTLSMDDPITVCVPTITPFPPTNSDEDAVPDSVRFEFTECTFTRGAMTHTLDGIVDVIDPTPSLTDFDIRTVFTSFSRTLANGVTGRTHSALFDGTREWSATADTLGMTMTNFLTEFTYPNGTSASHLKNWVARFTADTPGSIMLGEPLPAGELVVAGTSTWERSGLTWDLVASTPTPQHFNPACTVAPRFDSGVLLHAVTRSDSTVTVQIEFTACGTYTVTRL